MSCLIIDTSTERCILALVEGDRILSQRTFAHENTLSRTLLPSIQECLREQEKTMSALNLIAVGTGPGSYTGTRVGVAVAKSLAFGLNILVIPFCSSLIFNLEALLPLLHTAQPLLPEAITVHYKSG